MRRSTDEDGRLPMWDLLPGDRGDAPRAWERASSSAAQGTVITHEGGEVALLDQALERQNIVRALQRVERNAGAPGVDGMTVAELRPYLHVHWSRLRAEILQGQYRPQPVRRVDIPKPGGGIRHLGIPTVLDRLIQQALLQVLTAIFDPHFSAHSYGYRPGRRAHDAVRQAREYVRMGRSWVVDLDIDRFFDRVNHDMVMARIARRVQDMRVLKLLRAYLQGGMMVNGVVVETAEGTPQGGPLSPLLANILLDDLDRELARRGHDFVRYADDVNIYVATLRAGGRVRASITRFLELRLKLRVNTEKSAVDRAIHRAILGFSFLPGRQVKIRIDPQALAKGKATIRKLTRRNQSQSMAKRIQTLNAYLRGWVNYWVLAETPSVFDALEEWVRRRLRQCLWRQWRRVRTRYRELRRLGVPERDVHTLANTRRGSWRIAGKALSRRLGTAFWRTQGLESVTKRYNQLRVAW